MHCMTGIPYRFHTYYYLRDSTKPFAAKKYVGVDVPDMAISLVIDRSGSMEHIVYKLKTMSISIALACDELGIPLSIWALLQQSINSLINSRA